MRNRKISKNPIQIRRLGSLNQKRSPFALFYPDFSRHFRHSGSPDRQFFRKTEVRNLQFGVNNARCGAMRAIFTPFSDPFPVEKTGNFSKIYVKKEVFHNHFWHIGNPKAIKQLPINPTERFSDTKIYFPENFFNRTENHTPTHG